MRYCKKKRGKFISPLLPTAKCYFCSWSKAIQPMIDNSELMEYTAQNSALVNTWLRVTGVAIHTVAINGPNTSHTVACAHSIIIPILRKMFSITIKFKGLHPMYDIEIKKRGNLFPPFSASYFARRQYRSQYPSEFCRISRWDRSISAPLISASSSSWGVPQYMGNVPLGSLYRKYM